MVKWSFMSEIAPEPHDWSELPSSDLRHYLKRYGVIDRETPDENPSVGPTSTSTPLIPSCGNGRCEEGETVETCPADCKNYPEQPIPLPSCDGLANGPHCYPSNCCDQYFICLNNRLFGPSTLPSGSICYDGIQISANDHRCEGVICHHTLPASCGDGICAVYESCSSCPQDCGDCSVIPPSPTNPPPTNPPPTNLPPTNPPPTNPPPTNPPPTNLPPTNPPPTNLQCNVEDIGFRCYPRNCCGYAYQCVYGETSPLYPILEGGVCYDGNIVDKQLPSCQNVNCDEVPMEYCGDGICQEGENCSNCPQDCGTCPTISPTNPPTNPPPTISPSPPTEKLLVGYYTNWSQYRQGTSQYWPENIDPTKFTHLVYAFAYIARDTWQVEQVEWNDVNEWNPTAGLYYRFNRHIHTKNPKCKTLLAFGGWNFNFLEEFKDIFSAMAETKANRAACIQSIISWVRKHEFDGVDIDWEYPGWEDLGGRPQDKENFVSFVQELRTAIDNEANQSGKERLLLTLAVAAGYDKIDKAYDIPRIRDYVDYVSVMTYDLHGQWEMKTGAASGLYPPANYEPGTVDEYYTGDYAIQYWISHGMPREKIVMGLAAYGRGWTLESSEPGQTLGAPAIRGCDPMKDTQQEGVLNYIEALTVIRSGGVTAFDVATTTMYVQKGDQWYSYEDPSSILYKVDYIKQQNLLGGMLWAVDNDDFNDNNPITTAIYNSLYAQGGRRDGRGRSSREKYVIAAVLSGVAIIALIAVLTLYMVYRKKHPQLRVVRTASKDDSNQSNRPNHSKVKQLKQLKRQLPNQRV